MGIFLGFLLLVVKSILGFLFIRRVVGIFRVLIKGIGFLEKTCNLGLLVICSGIIKFFGVWIKIGFFCFEVRNGFWIYIGFEFCVVVRSLFFISCCVIIVFDWVLSNVMIFGILVVIFEFFIFCNIDNFCFFCLLYFEFRLFVGILIFILVEGIGMSFCIWKFFEDFIIIFLDFLSVWL